MTRPANDMERAVLARRADRHRESEHRLGRAARNEALRFVLITVAVLAGLAFLLRGQPPFPIFASAMACMFAVIGIGGLRAARRRSQERLLAVARDEEERARAVTVYRLAVDRIVTAADTLGEGEAWWLFRLEEGEWLVFSDSQWADLDADARTWHRNVEVVLDGSRAALAVRSEGSEVTVERRDLRPPDFVETKDTLYWTPPESSDALPVTVRGDPFQAVPA
jgi:hypothetical protein